MRRSFFSGEPESDFRVPPKKKNASSQVTTEIDSKIWLPTPQIPPGWGRGGVILYKLYGMCGVKGTISE